MGTLCGHLFMYDIVVFVLKKDVKFQPTNQPAVICAKTAERIEMSFGFWAQMGPRNHVRWEPRSLRPIGRGNCKGEWGGPL